MPSLKPLVSLSVLLGLAACASLPAPALRPPGLTLDALDVANAPVAPAATPVAPPPPAAQPTPTGSLASASVGPPAASSAPGASAGASALPGPLPSGPPIASLKVDLKAPGGVTISWDTNQPTFCFLTYQVSKQAGGFTLAFAGSGYQTHHEVFLAYAPQNEGLPLIPGQTYTYQISAETQDGQRFNSPERTFDAPDIH